MSKWPVVKLSDVLTRIERAEKVDAAKSYNLLGIRLEGNGPFLRETVIGTQTSAAKLFRVEEGDFIYSRLFACRGAFGVITQDLNGCYVSNEFPTFAAILDKVALSFLKYWFRQESVISLVDADCTGSTPLTRNRYKENFFLALEILLPPLAEQQRIVARIEELAAQINEAKELRRQATEEIKILLMSKRQMLFGEKPANDWPSLGMYVSKIESGKSPAADTSPASMNEWGVLKTGAVSFGVFNEQENKALSPSYAIPYPLEVRSGDFLMNRANTVELVGACALVRETRAKLILSDKIFRFIFSNENTILPEYLEQLLKSPVLRGQIEQAASGTSPTMKNISKEKVLTLRIPPFNYSEQQRIVAELGALQAEIDSLKHLQAETSAELDALLPAVLDRAFKGEL